MKKLYMFVAIATMMFLLTGCGKDATASSTTKVSSVVGVKSNIIKSEEAESPTEIKVENEVLEEKAPTVDAAGKYISVSNFINGDNFDLEGFFEANGAVVKYYEYDEVKRLYEVDHPTSTCKGWFQNGWNIFVDNGVITISVLGKDSSYTHMAIVMDNGDSKMYSASIGQISDKTLKSLDEITRLVLENPESANPLAGATGNGALYSLD